ncbi:MAG: tRNA dihydrouridine synthase [Puniceicoccaceae bacterium]
MESTSQLRPSPAPTALAPMQNVTDLAFMQVVSQLGGPPDYFFTEYFSVHCHTHLDPAILRSITENQTGQPVYAQILGNQFAFLQEAAIRLLQYPVAGIDLNLGCPAPKVYKRNAGGGLLRHPGETIEMVARLRDTIPGSFSVKMRTGFEHTDHFSQLLEAFSKLGLDFLTVHGRTVADGYRAPVRYDLIRQAVEAMPCPVYANGNISSASRAREILQKTGAYGLMIGRAAIRNPWIFRQIREDLSGITPFAPTLEDVFTYIELLHQAKSLPEVPEIHRIAHLKRYLVFIGEGVDPEGAFLNAIRRARTREDCFSICETWLKAADRRHLFFPPEPFEGVIARPNQEGPVPNSCSAHVP